WLAPSVKASKSAVGALIRTSVVSLLVLLPSIAPQIDAAPSVVVLPAVYVPYFRPHEVSPRASMVALPVTSRSPLTQSAQGAPRPKSGSRIRLAVGEHGKGDHERGEDDEGDQRQRHGDPDLIPNASADHAPAIYRPDRGRSMSSFEDTRQGRAWGAQYGRVQTPRPRSRSAQGLGSGALAALLRRDAGMHGRSRQRADLADPSPLRRSHDRSGAWLGGTTVR